MFEVQSDGTSVLLTWTTPDPLGDTTGYTISYTEGGSSVSEAVSGGDSDWSYKKGDVRHIYCRHFRTYFSSEGVEWETVTLIPG